MLRSLQRVCLLVLLASSLVSAEELPLTFDQALELVTQRHPLLAAQQAARAAADELIKQAGVRPNPYVQFQLQSDGFDRVSQVGLAIGQRVELGRKKDARVWAAETARQVTEGDAQVRLSELRLNTRMRFLQLLFAQERESLATQFLELSERHLAIAEARLASGDAAGVDVTAMRSATERRRVEQLLAIGRRRKAAAALAELVAPEGDSEPVAEGSLAVSYGDLPPVKELFARTVEGNPELARAGTVRANKEALVQLEQARGVSDVALQLGLYSERDVYEAGAFQPPGSVLRLDDTAPLLQFQVQIPLPINDTNSGNIEAARAMKQKAQAEGLVLKHALKARLVGLYHTYDAQREARRLLEENIVPDATKTMEVTETSYRLGLRNLVELLLAREGYLKAREDLLEATFQQSMTVAALEAAVGSPLSPPIVPTETQGEHTP